MDEFYQKQSDRKRDQASQNARARLGRQPEPQPGSMASYRPGLQRSRMQRDRGMGPVRRGNQPAGTLSPEAREFFQNARAALGKQPRRTAFSQYADTGVQPEPQAGNMADYRAGLQRSRRARDRGMGLVRRGNQTAGTQMNMLPRRAPRDTGPEGPFHWEQTLSPEEREFFAPRQESRNLMLRRWGNHRSPGGPNEPARVVADAMPATEDGSNQGMTTPRGDLEPDILRFGRSPVARIMARAENEAGFDAESALANIQARENEMAARRALRQQRGIQRGDAQQQAMLGAIRGGAMLPAHLRGRQQANPMAMAMMRQPELAIQMMELQQRGGLAQQRMAQEMAMANASNMLRGREIGAMETRAGAEADAIRHGISPEAQASNLYANMAPSLIESDPNFARDMADELRGSLPSNDPVAPGSAARSAMGGGTDGDGGIAVPEVPIDPVRPGEDGTIDIDRATDVVMRLHAQGLRDKELLARAAELGIDNYTINQVMDRAPGSIRRFFGSTGHGIGMNPDHIRGLDFYKDLGDATGRDYMETELEAMRNLDAARRRRQSK